MDESTSQPAASGSSPEINPYAPTAMLTEAPKPQATGSDDYKVLSRGRTAVRWVTVCSISAVPSFFLGMAITQGRVLAMLTGILIFSLVYTFLDYHTAHLSWRKDPLIRRTLRFTYGTRIVISVLLPIGAVVDMMCGIASTSFTQAVAGQEFMTGLEEESLSSFGPILFLTLVQGGVMNVVLAVFGGLILLLSWIARSLRS